MSRVERARAAGFTLIEVLLAMAILAFITSMMWGSFSQMASNKRVIEASQDRLHTVRVALMRMSREIEMSYLSLNDPVGAPYPSTLFASGSKGNIDELSFSYFGHQRLRAGLAEGDTAVVTYTGEHDPDDGRVMNLMRRETRRLQAEDIKTLPAETYILCPDIASLKFTFYDAKKKEWEHDWDTRTVGVDYLPTHVRITLTVYDEHGDEVSYSTDARVQMTERLLYQQVPN